MKPDFVAHHIVDEVGAVGDKRLTALGKPLLDVVARDSQQGAQHLAVAGRHAGEAVEASAPDEVHENGLDLVVGMMGHAHGGGADVVAELTEIAVAQVAGGHLHTDMMEGGIGARVEVDDMEGDVLAGTQLAAELLVAVGLGTTQPEVAMHGLDLIAQRPEGEQQGHAVGSSRQAHEIEAVGTEQLVTLDEIGYFP